MDELELRLHALENLVGELLALLPPPALAQLRANVGPAGDGEDGVIVRQQLQLIADGERGSTPSRWDRDPAGAIECIVARGERSPKI